MDLWRAIRTLGLRRGWRYWLWQAEFTTETRAMPRARVHHGEKPSRPGWRRKE